jgi:hypothetical protein
MNATRAQLTKQFNSIKSHLPVIESAAQTHGFEPSLIIAIGSRETEFDPKYQRVGGDNNHGFSWWQIDIRSYPEFVKSGDWKDVGKAVNKCCEVLAEKQNEVRELAGRHVLLNGTLLRCAVAGYNCGSGPAYRNFINHDDPDRGTTGKDYSADVLARQKVFSDLLGVPDADAVTTKVSVTPQGGVDVETATDKKPDAPAEITPDTATVVTPSKPSLLDQAKDISIPAGLGGVLATIGKVFMSIPPWAWALIIIAIILSAVYLINERHKRALAKTLKAADVAADPNKNNIWFG